MSITTTPTILFRYVAKDLYIRVPITEARPPPQPPISASTSQPNPTDSIKNASSSKQPFAGVKVRDVLVHAVRQCNASPISTAPNLSSSASASLVMLNARKKASLRTTEHGGNSILITTDSLQVEREWLEEFGLYLPGRGHWMVFTKLVGVYIAITTIIAIVIIILPLISTINCILHVKMERYYYDCRNLIVKFRIIHWISKPIS